jgi:hypothetical protein
MLTEIAAKSVPLRAQRCTATGSKADGTFLTNMSA